MAWSLRDTAEVIEAEEEVKELADDTDTDDRFLYLMNVILKDEDKARQAMYFRIRARKWRQTEGKSW